MNHNSSYDYYIEMAKEDLEYLLWQHEVVDIENSSNDKIAQLYLIDEQTKEQVIIQKSTFEGRIDDKDLERTNFSKIANFVNPNKAASHFYVYLEKKWKQVNDPVKVKERLKEELEVWANSYKKHAFKALEENEDASAEFIAEQKKKIFDEIFLARLKNEYVIGNFDDLDVRICSKKRAKEYGTLIFNIDGKRHKKHLSSKVPNVLYYEKGEYRPNNKLDIFLAEAHNIYGDVYFSEEDSEAFYLWLEDRIKDDREH